MKLAQKAVLAATFAALSWEAIKAYPVEAATVSYDFTLTVTKWYGSVFWV